MFKLKVNNVDILPYILIFLVASLILIHQLSLRNVIKIEYEWILGRCIPIFLTLSVINYIKKIHSPKGVNLSDLVSTEDIRTPSFKYSGFINQGTDISFVKFYFSENEIYLYYRNFFPLKIYYGPFIINIKGNLSSNSFIISEFRKTSSTEAKISIASQNRMTYYTFYMRNISKRDFKLLNQYFTNNFT